MAQVMKREHVYAIIDTERDYQDSLGPDRTDKSQKSVGDYLVLLHHYSEQGIAAWAQNPGNREALREIRKVAAIAVRCMEEHGAEPRG